MVSSTAIRYSHHELKVSVDGNGEPWVYDGLDLESDEDWE